MKKIMLAILNWFWMLQFKKAFFNGPDGYHCRDCVGGNEFFCGEFYCPIEKEPQGKLEYRFNWRWYQIILKKWRTLIS